MKSRFVVAVVALATMMLWIVTVSALAARPTSESVVAMPLSQVPNKLGVNTRIAESLTAGLRLATTSLRNAYVDVVVAENGQFTMATTGGDPQNPNDNNKLMLYGYPNPWSSYTTVRINGLDYRFGSQSPRRIPDGVRDVIRTPRATVQVDQLLSLTEAQHPDRKDTLRICYRVRTLWSSGGAPSVGVRLMLDTMLGSNDGAPFRIPGVGAVTSERDFTGAGVPQYWRAYTSLSNPTTSAQGTLRALEATTPSRLVIANWSRIYSSPWDFVPSPSISVTGDSATGIYWNPTPLAQNTSRDNITYYGVSDAIVAPVAASKPVVVFVSGLGSDTVKDKPWRFLEAFVYVQGRYPCFVAQVEKGARWPRIDSQSPYWGDSARRLDAQLNASQYRNRPIILVGHSMGGLISRAYAEMWHRSGHDGLVSGCSPYGIVQLGTPNGGSPLGTLNFIGLFGEAATKLSQLGNQAGGWMHTFNARFSNSAKVPIYRIAGTAYSPPRSVPPGYRWTLAWFGLEPSDFVVSRRSVWDGPSLGFAGAIEVPAVHGNAWYVEGALALGAGSVLPFDGRHVNVLIAREVLLDVQDAERRLGRPHPDKRPRQYAAVRQLRVQHSAQNQVASLHQRMDDAPAAATCVDTTLWFDTGSSSVDFTPQGDSMRIVCAPDSGTVAASLTNLQGGPVPCEWTTDDGLVIGVAEDIQPGVVHRLTLTPGAEAPSLARLIVADNGPMLLRFLPPAQVDAGGGLQVQAAVYRRAGDDESPSIVRWTQPVSIVIEVDGGPPLLMHDDGVAPDETATDGIYAVETTAPNDDSVCEIKVKATGVGVSGRPFFRTTHAEVTLVQPRANLSRSYALRQELDEAGRVSEVLLDVGVVVSQACTLSVGADLTSAGTLVAQPESEVDMSPGGPQIVTLRVPAEALYGALAGGGDLSVDAVTLADISEGQRAILDTDQEVLSTVLDTSRFAVSMCSAELVGANPARDNMVTVIGDAVSTLTEIRGVEFSVDDSGIWEEVETPSGGWGAAHSAWATEMRLPDGDHEIDFRAVGADGPIAGATCTLTFTVDTVPPAVTHDAPSGWVNSRPVVVTLEATDAGTGVASVQFRQRGMRDWIDYERPIVADHSGQAVFECRATDYAGNVSAVREFTVSIDTTPPVTTASDADSRWHRAPVWLWLTASDDLGGSGVARTEYKLDAGDWTAGASCTVPAPADHSGDGEHTVAYRSVDAAGNVEPAKTVTVWIDTVRPAVAAPKAAKAKRGAKATLRYKVTDAVPNSGKAVVVIQVKNAKGKLVKTLKLGQRPVTNALQSAAFTVPKKWPRGSYRFSVYATDAAGNKQLKVASNRLIVR